MRKRSRKILVASLGVATVAFTSCTNHPTGNLRPAPDAPPDTAHVEQPTADVPATQPAPADDKR